MIEVRADNYVGTMAHPLLIGRKGENLVRVVAFCLDKLIEQYGEGSWEIVNVRPTESTPYLAANTYDGLTNAGNKYACWNVSDTDTAIPGNGKVELRYYPSSTEGITDGTTGTDGRIYKTRTWVTKIEDSIGSDYYKNDPYNDVLDRMAQYAAEAKEGIDAAAESASAAKESENKAAEYATSVAENASKASTAATNAATSETNAGKSASAASTSASNASTSASNASKSASAASTSATNAATSEKNASTSATNAATSEKNAASSESDALKYREAASTSASAAATSATNAASSASTAQTAANTASTNATNAKASATSAASSATAAAESAANAFSATPDGYSDISGYAQAALMINADGEFVFLMDDGT